MIYPAEHRQWIERFLQREMVEERPFIEVCKNNAMTENPSKTAVTLNSGQKSRFCGIFLIALFLQRSIEPVLR